MILSARMGMTKRDNMTPGWVVVNRHLVPKGYLGITLWPFIIMRGSNLAEKDLRHKRIHLRQQLEMGVLLFYMWYGVEYLLRRLRSRTHLEAYRNISFEREAYAKEAETNYIHTRRFLAWTDFLK